MTQKKRSGLKWIASILAGLLGVFVLAGLFNYNKLQRLHTALSLFDAPIIAENFRNLGTLFESRAIHKGETVWQFKRSERPLPETYVYKGETRKISDFLARTETTGFIVVRDDTILYEKYSLGNTEESKATSWSVAKSFVSALFGIAIQEGHIKSIEESVTDYVPALAPSGYNGVRLKDVLQMSSGVRFNEDYSDLTSDINRLNYVFAFNTPLVDFVNTLKQERRPGTYHNYVSMDTQVLGMVITEATGRPLTEYLEEKLWKPMGMESDATWQIDSTGMEAAFMGLNVVLRDYARFGRLYLHRGNWNGTQLVPEQWVKASITPDAPHLMPGKRDTSKFTLGYGYQWWIPENANGDFMAIGVYGQSIYVSPRNRIVIARTSAYADYTENGGATGEEMEMEEIEVFKAIADSI